MNSIVRTNSLNTDFKSLVAKLDEDLKVTDGDDHAFYSQFNGIENIKYCMLFFCDGQAVGCGSIKEFNENTMEIKRMYVIPKYRGRGIASRLLAELEAWALELGMTQCILETGKRQYSAIKLYEKNNYLVTENYGQYAGVLNSVCFIKELI